MIFPPIFTQTSKIKQLLYDLDVTKTAYGLHPVSKETEVSLRRKSLLKSSLYSARIEGNTLGLDDIHDLETDSQDREKTEISNLVRAYECLPQIVSETITIDLIKSLHKKVMENLSSDAGYLRTEESAIYNQAGVAVYLTPAPQQIFSLLLEFCIFNGNSEDSIPVRAAISHIWFEKIHPFMDGNGRVGRLLSALILKKDGYDFGGLVPFEEFLEKNRDDYYYFLGKDKQDVTGFIEFYLFALLSQARVSLAGSVQVPEFDPYGNLLPRRAEIMRIIEDHKIITFNFLSRRFRAVPVRTLHNDLSQLIKAGLVQKMGTTRGVNYCLKNNKKLG
jgi:Fic family protein